MSSRTEYRCRGLPNLPIGLPRLKPALPPAKIQRRAITVNMDWPQQFAESELLERYEAMPASVSTNHPAMAALSQLLNRRR